MQKQQEEEARVARGKHCGMTSLNLVQGLGKYASESAFLFETNSLFDF